MALRVVGSSSLLIERLKGTIEPCLPLWCYFRGGGGRGTLLLEGVLLLEFTIKLLILWYVYFGVYLQSHSQAKNMQVLKKYTRFFKSWMSSKR